MKFIYCTCNISMSERLVSLLEKENIKNYQIVEKVLAGNIKGSPRLDTAVWPGYNAVICAQVNDDASADRLVDEIRSVNSTEAATEDEIISICSWPMENFIY